MSRTRLTIIVAAAAGSLAVLFVLYTGIPAGFLAGRAASSFSEQTGYRLAVGGPIRLSFWPSLAVKASTVRISDPADTAHPEKFSAEQIQLDISLPSLVRGLLRIRDVTITRPIAYVPMLRERAQPRATSPSSGSNEKEKPPVDVARVTIKDGTLVLYDSRARTESRFDGIAVDATLSKDDGLFDVNASGKAGDQTVEINVRQGAPVRDFDKPFPIAITLEAPGLIEAPLNATANAELSAQSFALSALRGAIGPHKLDGAVSVDFAGAKPFINADVNFARLDLGPAKTDVAPSSSGTKASEPWSDRDIPLSELNYFDAEIRFSADDSRFRNFRLSPLALKASVANGVLTASLAQTRVYEGQISGTIVIDASRPQYDHVARFELADVHALPLLSDAADFRWIEGRMTAQFDLRATGNNPRALAASVGGNAQINLQDGEIRGINVAEMVRSLMSSILSGWQENGAKKTDFSQFGATFQIKDGQATTLDLNLVGPLARMRGVGTIDLLTKKLSFRLDPKVVASLEGQGGQSDPLGLGVPVIVQGDWNAPQIYPDVAGIRDNPAAAFDQLRALGAGLFGVIGGDQKGDGSGDQKSGGDLMKSLNDIIGGKKDNPAGNADGTKPSGDGQGTGNFLRDLFGK